MSTSTRSDGNQAEDPLEGSQLLHYRIERRVGHGGMGVVYKAEDTRLGRMVALKFLNAASSYSPENRLRFFREARAAAAVHHPNICPIYEIVETNDRLGLALYWVNGPDLQQWMKQFGGIVPVAQALDVAKQVLMGLDAAHKKKVVHRDIKPGNLLMDTGNEVRIVDFGLAHIASETNITTDGTVLGTPAYMSPEQWKGENSDARTDLWATAVVLYEMLTGTRPFGSRDQRLLGHSIVHEPYTPLRSLRPDLPAELESLLDRALAKLPAGRYPTAANMLQDLRILSGQSGETMGPISLAVTQPALTVSPGDERATGVSGRRVAAQTAEVAGEDTVTLSRRKLTWIAGGVGAAALGSGLLLQLSKRSATDRPRHSLAVLPLDDLTQDNGYLSDGLADELISTLSNIRSVRVVARTSTFQFRGAKANMAEVSRQLNVDRVLTGSLLSSEGQIRVSVQLVKAEDGTVLWGETFSRPKSDVFAIVGQVADAVMGQLSVGGGEKATASRGSQANPEAYNEYLQGIYQWNLRSRTGLEAALTSFRRAIATAPRFALAWSGLADTQVLRALYGWVPPTETMTEAKDAALRALSLDANLAEAHNSLGLILLLHDWNRAASESSFRRALELNPGYATGHHWYGHFLAWSGRFTEAFIELGVAQSLDPLSLAIRSNVGWLLGLGRRFEKGIATLRSVLSMDSRFVRAHLYLGTLLGQLGRFEEAFHEMKLVRELSDTSSFVIATEAWLYARAGNMSRAAERKANLLELAKTAYVTPPEIMIVCVAMGQHKEAVRWLEKAAQERSPTLVWAGLDFRLDQVRQDPAFLAIIRKIG
ncbi:MAG: protein kinase [Bryobacterales bacterium]|nr:protein kinase [Bryobacterales bacterium]